MPHPSPVPPTSRDVIMAPVDKAGCFRWNREEEKGMVLPEPYALPSNNKHRTQRSCLVALNKEQV